MDLLAVQAHNKGIELASFLDPHMPTQIRGDPGRLRQIINNLVGNAIKFTTQGEVVLSVTAQTETINEAVLRFEVRDTGIGIDTEAQSAVFSRPSRRRMARPRGDMAARAWASPARSGWSSSCTARSA